ncbi:MAG: hypothetical protein IKS15_06160 [Opitutales bacterium]|nr:hypothetical protein [Opitutales bacterium]
MKYVLKFFKYSIFLLGLLAVLFLAFLNISGLINGTARGAETEETRIGHVLTRYGYTNGARYEVVESFKRGADRFFKIALDEGALKASVFPKIDPPFSDWKKYSELDGGQKQILDFAIGVQPGKEILSKEDFSSGDFLVRFDSGEFEFNEPCRASIYIYKSPHFYILERKIK